MNADQPGVRSPISNRAVTFCSALLFALIPVPGIALAILIYIYGFGMPWMDQWVEYDLFARLQQQALTVQDLFAQHNEHRLLFPRLCLIFASFFSPHTDQVELWITWSLACGSAVCLWRLSRSTAWSSWTGRLLLVVANLMLFNVLAWEDWLWGFQIGFVLPILAITAGVWTVSVSRGPWPFVWAAGWSVVNSFTVASGFTTWIVLIPLLLFPDGKFHWRWRGLLLHLLGLGGCLFLYLHGYVTPGYHPSSLTLVKDPVGALHYFSIYLGASLADDVWFPDIISSVVGAFLIGGWMACVALLIYFHRQPRLVARSLPWLTLCHFGLFCALITTIGRMGFGLGQALTSRYIVFSSLVPIGVVFAGACLFPAFLHEVKWPRVRHALGSLLLALPVLGFLIYVWSAERSIGAWRDQHLKQTRIQAALVFIKVPSASPLLEEVAYPDLDALKRYFEDRTKLGYPQVVLDGPALSPLADPAPPEPGSGSLTSLARGPDGIKVTGWSSLPQDHRSPEIVLVTLPDPKNQDSIVGMAFPDDGKWAVVLPPGSNLTGLKAWSFDGLACRAYQIPEAPGLKLE